MSTSTPRIQRIDYYIRNSENACAISEAIELQAELTAALARIAELEKDNDDKEAAYQNVSGHVQRLQDERNELRVRDEQWKTKFEQTHLTWAADGVRRDELEAELRRQLSESQAQLKQARSYHSGYCNEAQGKGRCNCWVVSVGEKDAGKYDTRVKELEAQLASAREDSVRLDWLLEFITQNGANGIAKMQWTIKDDEGEIVNDGDTIQEDRLEAHLDRYAIDSARGVTSPPAVAECSECHGWGLDPCPKCGATHSPAVAETGEKDAWQDIATAPKDGTNFLLWHGLHSDPFIAHRLRDRIICSDTDETLPPHPDNRWMALPPPPQGKEK